MVVRWTGSLLLVALLGWPLSPPLWALQSLPSREEILALAYPGAEIRAERLFLTEGQMERIRQAAQVQVSSALIARYTAFREGRPAGRAYVDTHVVRTKRESLLICLDAEGRVLRVEATAFLEPPEYLPGEAWYGQFRGKELGEDLKLHRAIRPLAGATLSARAATEAVRRVLAIDQLLREQEP